MKGLPGGGCQGDEQGLQNSPDVDDGALFGDEEVHGGKDEETMQHQAKHHRHGVEAQLLPHGRWVAHLQDLAGHQEDNAEWKVPGDCGGWRRIRSSSLMFFFYLLLVATQASTLKNPFLTSCLQMKITAYRESLYCIFYVKNF